MTDLLFNIIYTYILFCFIDIYYNQARILTVFKMLIPYHHPFSVEIIGYLI